MAEYVESAEESAEIITAEKPVLPESKTTENLMASANCVSSVILEDGDSVESVLVLPDANVDLNPEKPACVEDASTTAVATQGSMAIQHTEMPVVTNRDDFDDEVLASPSGPSEEVEAKPVPDAEIEPQPMRRARDSSDSQPEVPIVEDAKKLDEKEDDHKHSQEAIDINEGECQEKEVSAPDRIESGVYVPVVTGEASDLRSQIEGILDGDDQSAITERIKELDEANKQAGYSVTFGAEIEFEFVPDPHAESVRTVDKDTLYEQVVKEVQGTLGTTDICKGQVLWPDDTDLPILLNEYQHGTYNPDQLDTDISEIRTAPAGPLESDERYWRTIAAIGAVAERNGLMGMILSTHVNMSAVLTELLDEEGAKIERLPEFTYDKKDVNLLATVQYYLNLLRTLQLDAGLEKGIVTSEALPYAKDTSTTIHDHRLEFRHPIVGIVDPRIDIIACLAAVEQMIAGTIPRAALDELRSCRAVRFKGGSYELDHALSELVALDCEMGRFILPAEVLPSARNQTFNDTLNELVERVTSGKVIDYDAQGGQVLRDIVGTMSLVDGRIVIDPQSEYKPQLDAIFEGLRVTTDSVSYRVQPEVIFEDPGSHAQVRQEAASSDAARTIFGSALGSIISPVEAVARRQEAINAHMVRLDVA